MSIVDILVFLGAGVVVGATVMSCLKRDARGFTLLVRALNVVAFYRCFGKRSEGAVEHKLREEKERLEREYWERDHWRSASENCPSSNFFPVALARAEAYLVEYQEAFDYALALAILAGFGKVAMKVVHVNYRVPKPATTK